MKSKNSVLISVTLHCVVSSPASSVKQYLAALPKERREDVQRVRSVILKNLPKGFEEGMQYGMIVYYIPLSKYPETYNDQPLGVAALASQKNYLSLYLMNIYGDEETEQWFTREWKKAGKKLDKGKSCIRFKRAEDLPLELIGNAIARTSVEEFIAMYEKARSRAKGG
jgi:uncharacterized protein YdhG (YjbR/CyaY superfamily)